MKRLIIVLSLLLSGCATVDRVVCYGAGTCGRGTMPYASNQPAVNTLAQTVILPTGTVLIVRDSSSGQIQSVIPVSLGK
jgi:hypothetical protein